MTQRETDRILQVLEDHHDQRAVEVAELRNDIQALTVQVKETNGRVQLLEQWRQYMHGASDALESVKDGKAWRLPALTAVVAALVSVIVGTILQVVVR